MARRREKFVIADHTGYFGDEYRTKAEAAKALSEIVRDSAQRCRRSYKRCSVVGSAREGSVEIKIGGRQGYNMWQRYVIRKA